MPKVSVVIPTYNQPVLLSEAIDSVLYQTFNDYELIIVDDGSTDNTKDIVANYQKKTNKVRYIFKDNGGPSSARNAGIKGSRGEYIAFLDHDDIWLPTKLEKQSMFLDNNKNYAMVYSDAYEFNENGVTKEKRLRMIDRRHMSGYILQSLILKCFILSLSVMLRKQIVDEIGYFDVRFLFSQDWDYWLRVARNHEIGFLDEVLVGYRRHSGNITNNIELLIEDRHRVVDNAFDRYIFPHSLSKYRKLSHAFIWFELGEEYLIRGNHPMSREAIIKSLYNNPVSLKSYNILFKSFIPAFLLKWLRSIKSKSINVIRK